MIEIPPLEELRETRRRLAEQHGDAPRYAAMLAEMSHALPGVYVTQPLIPRHGATEPKAKAS